MEDSENKRLDAEWRQAHDWNNQLVAEHYALRRRIVELEAENKRLRMIEQEHTLCSEAIEAFKAENEQLAATLTTVIKLKAECYRLREGLRRAETAIWSGSDTYWACCRGEIEIHAANNCILTGHKPDCWLAKLLEGK
jgi:prefoldin subunit 5